MLGGRKKFPELRATADTAPPVYVLSHLPDPMGQQADQVVAMDRALAEQHVTATRTEVGCLTVYTDLRPALRPWKGGAVRCHYPLGAPDRAAAIAANAPLAGDPP